MAVDDGWSSRAAREQLVWLLGPLVVGEGEPEPRRDLLPHRGLARPRRPRWDDPAGGRRRSPRAQRLGDRVEVARGGCGRLGDAVAAELLDARLRQHQRDHRLGHHAGGRDGTDVGALVDRLGRLARATSTVSSERGTVLIGFIAARTRSTSPVDMPPSVPPARPVRRWITPEASRSSRRARPSPGARRCGTRHPPPRP